jgi:alkaline phosphatase
VRWSWLSVLSLPLLLAACATQPLPQPQDAAAAPGSPTSVVLFITDGASFETWNLAGHWARGERDGAPWSDWPIQLGMTTYPLNTSETPTMDAIPRVSYDPALAWSTAPVPPDETRFPAVIPGAPDMVYPSPIAGYQWTRQNYTDSAAGGTALATGVKTFNNAVAVDNFGRNLKIVTDDARIGVPARFCRQRRSRPARHHRPQRGRPLHRQHRHRAGDPGRARTAPLSGAGEVKCRVWCVPPQLSPMPPE